ncbi:MAG: ABC transporter substrate-binding protein [Deltaproteobacteria bacterium]|nr:ABC transporter substrate-binding protein [Deltaproteobacteria bacterium]
MREKAQPMWARAMIGCTLAAIGLTALTGCERRAAIVVGCKNFTEQIILGELIAQEIEQRTQLPVERRFYLAGTYIAQQSILAGRIDVYPEYTGTALTAILKQPPQGDKHDVYDKVKADYERRFHLTLGAPFGFNDTFAIEIRGETARELHLQTLSQAAAYAPKWRAGFGYEFMERLDGYKGLAASYGLRFAKPPRIMDLGLLTRALEDGQVDLIAGNMTDGLIPVLDLYVLEDDKHYFPPYEAVPVIREQTLARFPELKGALDELGGKISDAKMRQLNYEADGKKRAVKDVVADFLREVNSKAR